MKINRIIVLFGLLSLLFSACQSSRAIKGAKPSQEWSRSQELGRQAIGAPALAPIDSNSFAVLYPARAGGEDILKMFTLSTSGEVIAESEIMLAGSLRFPQMFYNPAGYFDLFVGNRLPQEETWQIKHIKLSLQGEQISPPERINPKDSGTGVFDAAVDGKGGYALVWDEDSFGETYYQQLDPQGKSLSRPVLLSASGRSPAVSFGDGNIVHTVWVEESGLNYAQIDPGQPHIFEPVLAVRLPVEEAADRGGNQLSGPEIASSEDWVYIFWAVLSLSDEEAGSSFANYVSFPVGAAQNGSPTRLLTFNDRGIPTADYKGDLNLEQIIPPPIYLEAMEKYGELYDFDMQFGSSTVTQTDIIGAVSDYILNLSAASQQRQTVAVSFAMVREDRLNKTMDIGVALFSKGLYQGYQNVSNTSEFSDQARLLIDAENNIHAVWREGAKGKSIYFASTAPQAKSYLDQFVPSDVFTIFAPMLLDSVVGISFLPGLLLWWAVPGFLIVGSTAYFYEGAKEKKKFTVGIILLAVLIYHMIKVTMLPSIFTYVPFSAWLFIPTGWRLPLRVATPLVIAGLGLLIAGRTFKQGKGIILPYVYAVLTDAVLVLMVYGVNFLGAF